MKIVINFTNTEINAMSAMILKVAAAFGCEADTLSPCKVNKKLSKFISLTNDVSFTGDTETAVSIDTDYFKATCKFAAKAIVKFAPFVAAAKAAVNLLKPIADEISNLHNEFNAQWGDTLTTLFLEVPEMKGPHGHGAYLMINRNVDTGKCDIKHGFCEAGANINLNQYYENTDKISSMMERGELVLIKDYGRVLSENEYKNEVEDYKENHETHNI